MCCSRFSATFSMCRYFAIASGMPFYQMKENNLPVLPRSNKLPIYIYLYTIHCGIALFSIQFCIKLTLEQRRCQECQPLRVKNPPVTLQSGPPICSSVSADSTNMDHVILYKCLCKWTHNIQIHVVQGSTVVIYKVLILFFITRLHYL